MMDNNEIQDKPVKTNFEEASLKEQEKDNKTEEVTE